MNTKCDDFKFSLDTPTLVIKSQLKKNCLLNLTKDNAQFDGLYVQITELTASNNEYLLNNLSNCVDSTKVQLGPILWCKKSKTETEKGTKLEKFGVAFKDSLKFNFAIQDKDAINIDLLMTAFKKQTFGKLTK